MLFTYLCFLLSPLSVEVNLSLLIDSVSKLLILFLSLFFIDACDGLLVTGERQANINIADGKKSSVILGAQGKLSFSVML